MSDDEKNQEIPVNEGEKGDPSDKRDKDKNVEPSNNNKGKNKNGGVESEEETSDDEISYEKWKAWRKKKKEQKKKKSNSRVIIDSSDDTDSKRRVSRSSNKGSSSRSKGKGDIEELLMTTLFLYLVSIMHQFAWASHLSLMALDITNERLRCSAT